MNKKQITILGGGTAGWLSALSVAKQYPTANISLIESEDIGIIGAGEGSVPFLLDFLEKLELDIDFNELISETNGTHKIGINFENWNGDNKNYFHDFFNGSRFIKELEPINYIGYLLSNNVNIDTHSISNKFALNDKSPIGLDAFEYCSYALHFDAHLFANYLKKIASKLNVCRIEGIATDFILNENNDVCKIKLESGESIDTDFVFDCSGFSRKIIGNLYKTKWISYMDKLRINSAMPFNIPQSKKEIKPYTIARAMDYGWLWQIPLQNRWGCGYLFDDTLIDTDTIKKELESHFGFSIQSNRVIKFEAGRYEDVWVNNCIAIGLSSGFTEPLEATSILLSLISLNELIQIDIFNKDLSNTKSYNTKISKCNDEIVDFLQLHYITNRNENEFWQWYKDNKNISNNLSNILHCLENAKEIQLDTDSIFTPHSWFMVSKGLGILNDSIFIEKFKTYEYKDSRESHYNWYNLETNKLLDAADYELDYLHNIKETK